MKERSEDGLTQAAEQGRRLVESARDAAERAGSYAQASVSRLSDRAQDVAGDLARGRPRQVERFTGRRPRRVELGLRRFVQDRPLQAILDHRRRRIRARQDPEARLT